MDVFKLTFKIEETPIFLTFGRAREGSLFGVQKDKFSDFFNLRLTQGTF